jgi:hypothetical protein
MRGSDVHKEEDRKPEKDCARNGYSLKSIIRNVNGSFSSIN